MRFLPLFAIATALLALSAPARSQIPTASHVVVPAKYTNVEGPHSCWHPYSYMYSKSRTQILYKSRAVAKTGGTVWEINFRGDGSFTGPTYPYRWWSVRIDAYITLVTPRTMSPSFAANRGSGPVTTLFNGTVFLPDLGPVTTPPAPWNVRMSFTKPFPFKVAQGNLLLEIICNGSSTPSHIYSLDGEDLYDPRLMTPGKVRALGGGCMSKDYDFVSIQPVPSTWALGSYGEVRWRWRCSGGSRCPYCSACLTWLGDRNDRYGPVKLPFDLAPLGGIGYYNGKPYSCFLHTNCIAVKYVECWYPSFQWGPLPRDPTLAGVTLYTQALIRFPWVNPLGLLTSDAWEITIGPDLPPVGDMQTICKKHGGMPARFRACPITQFCGTFN